jgi:hypothetical protein
MNVKPGGMYSNHWELGDKRDKHCGNAQGQLTVKKIILCLTYIHLFIPTVTNHVKRGGGFKWARVCPEKNISPGTDAIIEKSSSYQTELRSSAKEELSVNILLQDPMIESLN